MKYAKTAAILGISGGISYLTYQKICDEMFEHVFRSRHESFKAEEEDRTWVLSSDTEKVRIHSFDGLDLFAYDVHNHPGNPYMILVHGIWRNKDYMLPRAKAFDELGYNLLIVDQRGCGESQGDYYTYGYKESQDLMQWIDYLLKKDKDMKICLYGLSMGAATVMMTVAYKLPENIRCIVEDCGYSSIREEFDHFLRWNYKLSFTGIVLKLLELKMIERFGFNYEDVAIKTFLESNEKPILFVHGMEDEFVPYEMSKILYNHNKGEKKFYAVENAGHTQANTDPDYYDNIDQFIKTYLD